MIIWIRLKSLIMIFTNVKYTIFVNRLIITKNNRVTDFVFLIIEINNLKTKFIKRFFY